MWNRLRCRVTELMIDDEGMSTVEYAIGTVAAAAFGAVLYGVVTGDNILSSLTSIIGKALGTSTG